MGEHSSARAAPLRFPPHTHGLNHAEATLALLESEVAERKGQRRVLLIDAGDELLRRLVLVRDGHLDGAAEDGRAQLGVVRLALARRQRDLNRPRLVRAERAVRVLGPRLAAQLDRLPTVERKLLQLRALARAGGGVGG